MTLYDNSRALQKFSSQGSRDNEQMASSLIHGELLLFFDPRLYSRRSPLKGRRDIGLLARILGEKKKSAARQRRGAQNISFIKPHVRFFFHFISFHFVSFLFLFLFCAFFRD